MLVLRGRGRRRPPLLLERVRGQPAQALVQTHFIIHDASGIELALRIGHIFKHAASEQLVAQTAVETFADSVLPRMPRPLRFNRLRCQCSAMFQDTAPMRQGWPSFSVEYDLRNS